MRSASPTTVTSTRCAPALPTSRMAVWAVTGSPLPISSTVTTLGRPFSLVERSSRDRSPGQIDTDSIAVV